MKANSIHAIITFILMLGSCGQSNKKEEAIQHYTQFQEAIHPYVDGTTSFLRETGLIIEQKLHSTGQIKLSTQDSTRIIELFKNYKALAIRTKTKLKKMKPFKEFDLKKPALDYVTKNTKAISDSFNKIVLPLQDKNNDMPQVKIDSLVRKYSNTLKEANDDFSDTQRKFLDNFGIPANN